jgi:hypothetical protein
VPDTDENLSTSLILESQDDNCLMEIANLWPDSISLNASIIPEGIEKEVFIERTDLSDKINVYKFPKIDSQSNIQNPKFCVSKILINYERIGKYVLNGRSQLFDGEDFNDYHLNLPSESLFTKEFLTLTQSITETVDKRGLIQYGNTFAQCRIYPYGGLYNYGAHPKEIESCAFRIVSDGSSLSLRISPLSVFHNAGVDPFANQSSQDGGYKFVGIKEFSTSQKVSLYDELKSGACKIEITNKILNQKTMYASNSVLHIPNTNLITINFTQEEP